MKKFAATWIAIPVLAGLSGFAYAEAEATAESPSPVTITWQEPKSYVDVRSSNESRSHFRARVFKELDKYFNELAAELPEGQTLNITVTDLDLAGEVWPTFGMGARELRIIEATYIPRMTFSYELKSGDEVVKSAEVKLKDMAFMNRGMTVRTSEFLRYEKQMVKRWFDEEFEETLARL